MTRVRTTVAAFAALALSATLAVGAIAQDEPEPSGPLDETVPIGDFSIEDQNWLLSAQVVDGELRPLDEDVLISLRMVGGRLAGTGGCNGYGARYEIDGFDLSLQGLGHTLIGCGLPHGPAEAAYFANLERVASYRSRGLGMALEDEADEVLLEFRLTPASMVEGSWQVGMISDGKRSLEGNQHTSKIKATFAEDGTLTGTDGCSDYSAIYEVDGQNMRIGRIEIQKKDCKKPHRKNARRYYAALRATSAWSVSMFGLTLLDEDDVFQVTFGPTE